MKAKFMKTLYPSDLLTHLAKQNHTLLLDTNVFSTAAKSDELRSFIIWLIEQTGCTYTTIESVVFEVLNGSTDEATYRQRQEHIKTITSSLLPINFLDKIPDFNFLMSKLNANNKSFVDFQLAAALYKYRTSPIYLMTSDQKALPSFYTRDFVITTEHNSGHIVNFGMFRLDEVKYELALKGIS